MEDCATLPKEEPGEEEEALPKKQTRRLLNTQLKRDLKRAENRPLALLVLPHLLLQHKAEPRYSQLRQEDHS